MYCLFKEIVGIPDSKFTYINIAKLKDKKKEYQCGIILPGGQYGLYDEYKGKIKNVLKIISK